MLVFEVCHARDHRTLRQELVRQLHNVILWWLFCRSQLPSVQHHHCQPHCQPHSPHTPCSMGRATWADWSLSDVDWCLQIPMHGFLFLFFGARFAGCRQFKAHVLPFQKYQSGAYLSHPTNTPKHILLKPIFPSAEVGRHRPPTAQPLPGHLFTPPFFVYTPFFTPSLPCSGHPRSHVAPPSTRCPLLSGIRCGRADAVMCEYGQAQLQICYKSPALSPS